tara:strand:+ start:1494 stop:2123 length:630 start_codon:yes stop_codon:yes gene_type:complete
MNGTVVKNQLIFDFAAGTLGYSKSIFASTYLYLNSKASKMSNTFETMLGDKLIENDGINLKNLKFTDCINKAETKVLKNTNDLNPLTNLIGPIENIRWKQVYKGFKEYDPKIDDKDQLKLIKMDPGASVPSHSHGGKEFILVLEGSFNDEYGQYKKGDIQINDQKIKHTPVACDKDGCICLAITERDVIFFGKYGSIFNLFTFIKSFFK